jgi:hypothetical protein
MAVARSYPVLHGAAVIACSSLHVSRLACRSLRTFHVRIAAGRKSKGPDAPAAEEEDAGNLYIEYVQNGCLLMH